MGQSKEYRNKEKEILPWIRKKETYKFTFFNIITLLIGLLLLGLSLILVTTSHSGERNHRYNSNKSFRTEIYDRNWNRRGYIRHDQYWSTIYDKDWNRIGHIKNGTVYDKDWNRKLNVRER